MVVTSTAFWLVLLLSPTLALGTAETIPIQCGIPITGQISDPIELDLLPFSVPEGEIVEITVGDAQPEGPNFTASWRLLDGIGNPVPGLCGLLKGGANQVTNCGPLREAGNPYRIEVGDVLRRDTGTYRVFVNFLTTGCPAHASLILALTGCTRCRAGDRLTVQARLMNTQSTNIPIEVKLGVRLPQGQVVNIMDKHLETTFPPNLDTTVTIFDIILPAGLPLGLWSFEGALLEPTLGQTLSRNTRPFEVIP
jgi:hypothetical protein